MMAPKDIRSYPWTCECDLIKKRLADVVKDLEMGEGNPYKETEIGDTWRVEGPENRQVGVMWPQTKAYL